MCRGELGDEIERALTTVGITQDRVERWLGMSCGCEQRKARLNQLGNWAARIVSGKLHKAVEYLNHIIN